MCKTDGTEDKAHSRDYGQWSVVGADEAMKLVSLYRRGVYDWVTHKVAPTHKGRLFKWVLLVREENSGTTDSFGLWF